jgi:hypothetical protein
VRPEFHSRPGRRTSRGAAIISHAKTSSASRNFSSDSTRLVTASARSSAGVSGLSIIHLCRTLKANPGVVADEVEAEAFASSHANVIRSFKTPDSLAAPAALLTCAPGHERSHRKRGERQCAITKSVECFGDACAWHDAGV